METSAFSVCARKLWNFLPVKINKSTSVDIWKNKLKRVFLTVQLVYICLILAFLCILLYIALVFIINVFVIVDLNTGHALEILAFLCILIIL